MDFNDTSSIHSEDEADLLPSYTNARRESAPAYSHQNSTGRQDGEPNLVFSLRQRSRKSQKFISMGPPYPFIRSAQRFTEIASDVTVAHSDPAAPYPWHNTNREYLFEHKAGAGLSKSRPDIVVSAMGRDAQSQFLARSQRSSIFETLSARRSASTPGPDQSGPPDSGLHRGEGKPKVQKIAAIRYSRSGPLPWTPRAQVVYDAGFIDLVGHEGHGLDEKHKHDLELQRVPAFLWVVRIFGRDFAWRLVELAPKRLDLVDLQRGRRVVATFVYSEMGSWALKDAEVGRLTIPLQQSPNFVEYDGHRVRRHGLEDAFLEFVICTVIVAVTHWKNECKVLINKNPFNENSGEVSSETGE